MTGQKLYQKFRMHLEGYHLELWETINDGKNRTVDNFCAGLTEFKNELLADYTYEDQMDYLRKVKKPPKLTPSKFLNKLRMHNRLVVQLPDAPAQPGFSADQIKRQFLAAMPRTWRNKFANANMTLANTTIKSMDKQHIKDPPKSSGKVSLPTILSPTTATVPTIPQAAETTITIATITTTIGVMATAATTTAATIAGITTTTTTIVEITIISVAIMSVFLPVLMTLVRSMKYILGAIATPMPGETILATKTTPTTPESRYNLRSNNCNQGQNNYV